MAADGGAVWHLRRTAINSAEDNLGQLNRVLDEQSAQTLQDADLVLAAVESEFAPAELRDVAAFRRAAAGPEVERRLARKIAGLPQIGFLLLVDASGVVVNSSGNDQGLRRIDVRDRVNLAASRARSEAEFMLGMSAGGSHPVLYLARRLSAADGGLLGFAAAAIRLDYFATVYRSVDLGRGGAIALWNAGGTLLARYPPAPPRGERATLDSQLLAGIGPEGSIGLVRAADTVSGAPVLVAASRLANYPLITTTSLSIAAILATWRTEAIVIGVIGTMLCLAIVAIALLLRRHMLVQTLMMRAYARLADESHARRDLVRAVERAEAIAAERRLAEEALRHSERRFRDVAEISADWIWESDVNHRFVFLSGDSAQAVLGKTPWEMAGGDPEDDPHWRRHKADLDARRPFRGFRFSIAWPDGAVQHYAASGKPMFDERGGFQGFRGTLTNETEAILAADRASRAHRLLGDAVDSISEGFVIFDANDRLVVCNEAYRRMYSETAEQIVPGATFEEILRAGLAKGQIPDAEGREEEWIAERLLQHRQIDGTFEHRLSGGRWALASERRMSDGGTAGLRIDITALKNAQIALRENQLRLDEAEKIAHLGCSDFDLVTGRLTWSNETYRIFGIDPHEPPPTGDNYLALVDPRDRERLRAVWAELARGVRPDSFEHWIVRPDGESRLIRREHEMIRDRIGRPVRVVSTLQDVTLQRAAEQRARELERLLIHSQKLEALGIMAGGLAHELNNILAPVLSLAQVALEDFPADSRARGDLEMVVVASQRARDLVRQVLAFGRRQPLEKRLIDLGSVVHQSLRMMRATLPATIELIERLDPAPAIQADADQLQQVIVNLVTNAAQAIGDRSGRIVVGVAAHGGPAEQTASAVCLSVEDDGVGMDEAVEQRIFEPFFTTREADRGSGLGLSVVHGIVSSHGGRIELRTAPDQGSVFSIILPAAVCVGTIGPIQSAA